jgi:hypothetical protein
VTLELNYTETILDLPTGFLVVILAVKFKVSNPELRMLLYSLKTKM